MVALNSATVESFGGNLPGCMPSRVPRDLRSNSCANEREFHESANHIMPCNALFCSRNYAPTALQLTLENRYIDNFYTAYTGKRYMPNLAYTGRVHRLSTYAAIMPGVDPDIVILSGSKPRLAFSALDDGICVESTRNRWIPCIHVR